MFLSISLRLRVEVEALNMVEALGAYTRHRTASLLKPKSDGKGYRIIIVPAVSGQSIAYGYMKSLVELAEEKSLPVCEECKKYETIGGFLKHAKSKAVAVEKLVKECIVEDITGFMVAEAKIRRTSPIQFTYMIPDIDSSDVAIEPQFHARTPAPTQEPQPFQVEAGTAIYVLGIALDIDKIGTIPGADGKPVKIADNRIERIKTAVQAIGALIDGLNFGAKKARYLPTYDIVGAIAALSHPVQFMVSPARISRDENYIVKTINRASSYVKLFEDVKEEINIIYMDKEEIVSETKTEKIKIEKTKDFPELISKIIELIQQKIESSQLSSST